MLVPPASAAFVVTPHDTTLFVQGMARGLYIGGAGNVVVKCGRESGDVVTFTAVPVGTVLPVNCHRVNSTGTTATAIVGLL